MFFIGLYRENSKIFSQLKPQRPCRRGHDDDDELEFNDASTLLGH